MFARTRPAVADPLPWAAFLATALALAAGILLHARWLPLPLLATLLALLAGRLWMRRRGMGRVPAWIRLAIAVALVAAVAASLGSIFGREAGSALLAAMMTVKLVEAESRRDARVILSVTAFLMMASFLFDQGLLQVAMVAGACVLLLAAMYELDPGTPREAREAAHRAYSADGLREALRHLALAIPFAIVCFVLFPRLGSPLWGAPQDAFTGRTGISDRMEPGALAGLALDDSVAMRVRFDGTPPPPADRYWRGLVLWSFDGKAWGWPDAAMGWPDAAVVEPLGPPVDYEVTLEPTDRKWMFVLDAPLAAPEGATLTSDLQARAARAATGVTRYRGRSAVRYRADVQLPRGVAYLARRLPAAGNPRARELAAAWRAETGGDARAIAARALALYNESFSYSFEVPLLGADPIDDFLFSVRSGWCEHYASSFAFLMRAAGIPARVVVGFQGGLWNPAGGYFAVRRSDAHAWTEVWFAGEGWVRIDPTSAVAPERVSEDARAALSAGSAWQGQGWLADLRDRFDLVGFWWNSAVLQFSALRQRALFEDAGLDPDATTTLAGVMLGAALAALALAGAILGWRRRGRDPLRDDWRAFCARLARAGVARHANEGPLAFGARAAAALPAHGAAIRSLTDAYAGLRYAGEAVDPRAVAEWRRAARAFRAR
ncbi:MAG: transglutaminaseTgpA domain-containing protein [Xanthomonadaceae bacterium]|jgi:transglutaminase-like putative cysteine protease|nr:transglutaminaseTgpA domain-containing protein [Xanthomonadaceae bacterium]